MILALFVYTIAIFGLAYVVGHSVISLPIRERIAAAAHDDVSGDDFAPPLIFLALIECPSCFSWWVGFIAGASGILQPDGAPWYAWAFVLAFYSAGSSFILARLTGLTPKPGESP